MALPKLTMTERFLLRELSDKGPRTAGQLIDATECHPVYIYQILTRLLQRTQIVKLAPQFYSIPATSEPIQ
jgi:DNA-binding MarR family transcriptional regulator